MSLSRRHFFGTLALPAFAATPPAVRPNIVLIAADYLPSWVIGAYGNREIQTPHIDLLAGTGTRSTNHTVAAPAPEPSRATLLTGVAQPGAADVTLDKLLSALGYTGTTASLSDAAGFIDSQTAGKPFFLIATDNTLQPPYGPVSEKYAQSKFDTLNLERAAAPNARAGKEMLADITGNMRKAASAVTAFDGRVGALYARLGQKRLLDNTVVILTGTCGALLGRHGLWGAGDASGPPNMYQESVATPLIWSWPGHVPAQGVRPELVSTYDLVPTIVDLLAAERPKGNLCGRSYILLDTGKPLPKKEPWRSTIFGLYQNIGMARDHRYKIVVRDAGPGELFDLVADPFEKTNQYDNPQFVSIRDQMAKDLAAWKARYSTRSASIGSSRAALRAGM